MNKKDLINYIMEQYDIKDQNQYKQKLKFITDSVNIFFDSIKKALLDGDRVDIRGFGTFFVKKHDSYEGRNPRTGEKVFVEEKLTPCFRPGKKFKNFINGLEQNAD